MSNDIAIIPARYGSRRIPLKNIRNFDGLPVIAYSIKAALDSGCFDRVVVSTDSEEIAAIARDHGAETPFLRNAKLSDDFSSIADVVRDGIIQIGADADLLASCCCIFAAAPLLAASVLIRAKKDLSASGAPYIVPVVQFSHPPSRALFVEDHGQLLPAFNDDYRARTQDHRTAYHDAGQFYYGQISAWIERKPVLGHESRALILNRTEAVDIDDDEDWEFATIARRYWQSQKKG